MVGDAIVGLAVMRHLSVMLGIQISAISPAIDKMFAALGELPFNSGGELFLRLTSREAKLLDDAHSLGTSDQVAILVPLAPIITQLQRSIVPIAASAPQRRLRFPPESVRRRA